MWHIHVSNVWLEIIRKQAKSRRVQYLWCKRHGVVKNDFSSTMLVWWTQKSNAAPSAPAYTRPCGIAIIQRQQQENKLRRYKTMKSNEMRSALGEYFLLACSPIHGQSSIGTVPNYVCDVFCLSSLPRQCSHFHNNSRWQSISIHFSVSCSAWLFNAPSERASVCVCECVSLHMWEIKCKQIDYNNNHERKSICNEAADTWNRCKSMNLHGKTHTKCTDQLISCTDFKFLEFSFRQLLWKWHNLNGISAAPRAKWVTQTHRDITVTCNVRCRQCQINWTQFTINLRSNALDLYLLYLVPRNRLAAAFDIFHAGPSQSHFCRSLWPIIAFTSYAHTNYPICLHVRFYFPKKKKQKLNVSAVAVCSSWTLCRFAHK